MSDFKPARFGNAENNIVTGALTVGGAMVVNSITVTGNDTIPVNTSLVLIDIPSPPPVTIILMLPDIADVAVGHTISFKISTDTAWPGSRVFINGAAPGQGVDGGINCRLRDPWQAVTLCSNGTVWNIIRYFDGTI